MENRRMCHQVIDQMLDKIPEDKVEFINDLKKDWESSVYKAPEETIQWVETQLTLQKHIGQPTEDWHYEVLSIFTTKSVSELKDMV